MKIADLALLSDPEIYSSLKVDYSKRVELEQFEKVPASTESHPETGVGSGYQAALNEYQQCYRQNGDNWKIRCASVAEIPHDLAADQSKLQRASRAFQYIATHMLWEKFPFVLRTMLSSLTLPAGGSAAPTVLRKGLIRSSDNILNPNTQTGTGGEAPEMEISISSCQTIAKSRPSIVREVSRNDTIVVPEIAAAIGEAGVFGMSEPTDSICRQLSPSYARADKKNLWIMQVEHHQNESDGSSLASTNRFGPQFVCLIDSSVPRALAVEFCR